MTTKGRAARVIPDAALEIDKALAEIERGAGSAYEPADADTRLKRFRETGYALAA